jgi:hypothetical protein
VENDGEGKVNTMPEQCIIRHFEPLIEEPFAKLPVQIGKSDRHATTPAFTRSAVTPNDAAPSVLVLYYV